MKIGPVGASRFQLPPKVDVSLEDVIVTRDHHAPVNKPAIPPTRHKVGIKKAELEITPPLDRGGVAEDRREPLVILNESWRENRLEIEKKTTELVGLAKHEYQRLVINTAEGGIAGGILGAGIKGMSKGALTSGALGAAIGAGVGMAVGYGISATRTQWNRDQLQCLRDMRGVFRLYDRILKGDIGMDEIPGVLLQLEENERHFSTPAKTAFRELEKILMSLNQPEVVDMMRHFSLDRNAMQLRRARD